VATRLDDHGKGKRAGRPSNIQAKNATPTTKQKKNITHKRNQTGVGGWRSDNLTFSTTPINPDLDIQPTNRYELTQHPTKPTHTSLHRPDGTTIFTIENRRLDKLHDIYNKIPINPPFEESLAKLIHRQDKQHHPK